MFLLIQTKLLKTASVMLEKEKEDKKLERETTLSERVPPLQLSGLSMQDLQVCSGHYIGRHTTMKQHGSNAPHVNLSLMHTVCSDAEGALEDRCLDVYILYFRQP